MGSWGVAEAKAHFSEVIDSARQGGPQQITRNGKLVGLVVSPEEWEKKSRPAPAQNMRTTADFFRRSPLRGSGIDLTRSRSGPRKVNL